MTTTHTTTIGPPLVTWQLTKAQIIALGNKLIAGADCMAGPDEGAKLILEARVVGSVSDEPVSSNEWTLLGIISDEDSDEGGFFINPAELNENYLTEEEKALFMATWNHFDEGVDTTTDQEILFKFFQLGLLSIEYRKYTTTKHGDDLYKSLFKESLVNTGFKVTLASFPDQS